MKQLGWPLVLAAFTTLGLLAALLGGEAWGPVSWLALGVPVLVVLERLARAMRRR